MERSWHPPDGMTTPSDQSDQAVWQSHTEARDRAEEGLYDVEEVRRNAKRSSLEGPVTADYTLDLDRAYELLNQALASEIVCVLRYRQHQIVASGIDFPQVAAKFAEHAEEEEKHMMMIAERIDQLGGDPDFDPATVKRRSPTEFGSSDVLSKMIEEDLVAERVVIEVYRQLIRWFGNDDPTTRIMFEEILAEEEEHADELADLLRAVDPRAEPRADGSPV